MNPEEAEQTCCAAIKKFISLLTCGHSIHPTAPLALEHSEFLQVTTKINIRIIHVRPESAKLNEEKRLSNRNSLTEEYWFTRWNKPLKSGTCNCSFRRSQRYSKNEIRMSNLNNSKVSNYDVPATKIINVDTFAERLTQDTLFEAYLEYCITKDRKLPNGSASGFENYGFTDEVDHVIFRKKTTLLKPECVPAPFVNNNVKLQRCKHNVQTSQHKPLILLLHGIGSTADVWWNIITSLLSRGFEVAAPDMLGHGYSSAPNKRKAYKFNKLLDYTLAVFDYYAQKDENRKFIIIGHSFGSSLATALCRYRPQQIVQLVLISGGGPTALSAPVSRSEVRISGCLQLLISPLLFCGIKRSLFYPSRGKHFEPCAVDKSIPKYVLEYINCEQNWPEGDAAFHRRILIPTLLVHGLKDTQVTLVQECEMERTIPRAFLELIPTAGHMSMLETPEQLSHMILCFVDWWAL